MPTTVDDITDVLAGAEYCKERMKKCEANAQKALQDGDLALVAKFEGHLFAWTELLQKYMHESFNQGKTSDDLLKADGISLKKTRGRNASSKRADDSPEPRTVGDGSDGKGVELEEHPAVAARFPNIQFATINPEMFEAIGKVKHPISQVPAQGSDDGESPDTDSSGTETE